MKCGEVVNHNTSNSPDPKDWPRQFSGDSIPAQLTEIADQIAKNFGYPYGLMLQVQQACLDAYQRGVTSRTDILVKHQSEIADLRRQLEDGTKVAKMQVRQLQDCISEFSKLQAYGMELSERLEETRKALHQALKK